MNRLKSFFNSSVLLNRVRYAITPLMIRRKSDRLLFDDSRFYRVNLNCRGDAYYGYVNIEDTRTKGRVFVSALDKLPFSGREVKFLIADMGAISPKRYEFGRMFREWSRVMVPNGILTLDNFGRDDLLVRLLRETGFEMIGNDWGRGIPVAHFLNDVPVAAVTGERGLEYMRPADAFRALADMVSKMAASETVEISVRNETPGENGRPLSFFDKSNLSQMLDGIGAFIENIEIRGSRIQALISRKDGPEAPGIRKERKKVCAIEQYLMFRYNRMGFDEDGLPTAIERLGYDCLALEGMRNINPQAIRQSILSYKPDYIVFRLKEVLPLMAEMKGDLRRIGTKVMFWFTDPDHPEPDTDLKGVVDCMFLSNRGQLDEYRKAYNLDRVHFMAQSYMPNACHRIDLPVDRDIAFTGALSKDRVHSTRRIAIQQLRQKYSVEIRNNVRGTVAEFYSRAKFVFGASNFPYECYTSNRLFIAMGCGSVYLTQKFPGLELFARNRQHLLWFQEYPEMLELVDYYMKNEAARKIIGDNALKLAKEKHTTVHRFRNMIDIAEGKTEKFYGFLE